MNAEAGIRSLKDAENMGITGAGDGEVSAGGDGGCDEAADFDVVGLDAVGGAVEGFDSFDV